MDLKRETITNYYISKRHIKDIISGSIYLSNNINSKSYKSRITNAKVRFPLEIQLSRLAMVGKK